MKSVEIKGSLRASVGKPDAKKLRKEDKVPSVLYGTKEPVHFSAPVKAFKKLVYTPDAYLVDLDIDGTKYEAVLKDTQFHPVSDSLIHADFLQIEEKKATSIAVPVRTKGNAPGVIAGGRLVLNLRNIVVKAIPSLLPDEVMIDISALKIGDSVKIKDLNLGEGVEALNAEGAVVVGVRTTRVALTSDVDLEEGEEGEEGEGEEAPAEGGEAPAEG